MPPLHDRYTLLARTTTMLQVNIESPRNNYCCKLKPSNVSWPPHTAGAFPPLRASIIIRSSVNSVLLKYQIPSRPRNYLSAKSDGDTCTVPGVDSAVPRAACRRFRAVICIANDSKTTVPLSFRCLGAIFQCDTAMRNPRSHARRAAVYEKRGTKRWSGTARARTPDSNSVKQELCDIDPRLSRLQAHLS